jgi:hypothetical protein
MKDTHSSDYQIQALQVLEWARRRGSGGAFVLGSCFQRLSRLKLSPQNCLMDRGRGSVGGSV